MIIKKNQITQYCHYFAERRGTDNNEIFMGLVIKPSDVHH